MTDKANCYDCKFRGTVPGSCHSSCRHPSVKTETDDPLGGLLATFASVGRQAPIISEAHKKLNVRAVAHGIQSGWFNWPWNFDPAWLLNCDGFEAKNGEK